MSTKVKLPSLNEFWNMLHNHDWSYNYSDDHSVWRRGEAQIGEIRAIVEAGGEEYKKLFNEYSEYAWRKDNSIKQPVRPERTKEDRNSDREVLVNLSNNLDSISKEIWALEEDQITDATQLWKLYNPLQSMLYKIRDLVEEKSKSPSWNTVAYKGYKRIKEDLDKYN